MKNKNFRKLKYVSADNVSKYLSFLLLAIWRWNKNKNNFTCLLLYQFAAILSQKYQAFPAVVAFNQGLPIFKNKNHSGPDT
jgi:hypothetical protein